MKLVVICGSTNAPSNSTLLAQRFVSGFRTIDASAQVQEFQLKDLNIEQFTLKHYEPTCDQGDDFCRLRDAIIGADAVVVASPVWNFGVPGMVKNFIDRMGSFGLDAQHAFGTLQGKPFYLIYTMGAPTPAQTFMRRMVSFVSAGIEYFGACVVGTHFEGGCTPGKGVFGLVVDQRPGALQNAEAKGREFATTVRTIQATGKLPARLALRRKLVRLGQLIKKKLGM